MENSEFVIIDGVLNNYSGKDDTVIIPKGIILIGGFSFFGNADIMSVHIPDGVIKIGFYSFGECKNLKNITIPNSVTSINRLAFKGCKSLTSVTIPNSVTYIADGGVFDECDNIILHVTAGSYAEQYAIENGISFIVK